MGNRRVTVVSSNRADFYLLESVIMKLKADQDLSVCFVVTGAHLLESMGKTIDDIVARGIHIDEEIKVFSDADLDVSLNYKIASTINAFDEFFNVNQPDLVLLLGDRFEIMAIAIAASNLNLSLAHLYGGETSMGSMDESYRNVITLLSKLHFVSDEIAATKVRKLLDHDSKIYEVGHLGLENIRSFDFHSKEELFKLLDINVSTGSFLCTISLHPATNEVVTPEDQIKFLDQLTANQPEILFIATASNNDLGGKLINNFYREKMLRHSNFIFKENLGTEKYLNLCKVSNMVIGNSSSLMFEVPSLGVPVINLGERQSGRSRMTTVINLPYSVSDVSEFLNSRVSRKNKLIEPQNNVESSELIVKYIKEYFNEI